MYKSGGSILFNHKKKHLTHYRIYFINMYLNVTKGYFFKNMLPDYFLKKNCLILVAGVSVKK